MTNENVMPDNINPHFKGPYQANPSYTNDEAKADKIQNKSLNSNDFPFYSNPCPSCGYCSSCGRRWNYNPTYQPLPLGPVWVTSKATTL